MRWGLGAGGRLEARDWRPERCGSVARVQQVDERIQCFEPDARIALGQDVGPERHRRPHLAHGQQIADARGVAAHQVALQRLERVGRDLDFGERSEPGVDPVDRLLALCLPIDDDARRADARGCCRRDSHALAAIRNRDQCVHRQRVAVQLNHGLKVESWVRRRTPDDDEHPNDEQRTAIEERL
jgi:hypothetical protein